MKERSGRPEESETKTKSACTKGAAVGAYVGAVVGTIGCAVIGGVAEAEFGVEL